MKSRRQQRAADRERLRELVTKVGATPNDLARLTGLAETKWRQWLRGDKPVPSRVIEFLEVAFAHLPDGALQNRINFVNQLQRCRDLNVIPSVFEIPVDPMERATMRQKVEAGVASMRSLCGMRRPLDPDEREYLLQELSRPYQPSAVTAH